MLERSRYNLSAGRLKLAGSHAHVMGVLNVTPDSFSDGGNFVDRDRAVDRAAQLIAEGAAIIDIGGESTRPGAASVSTAEEIDRVMPVVQALRQRFETPLSVDTSSAQLMQLAIDQDVALINDVRALGQDGSLAAVAGSDVAVCLMHMQGKPGSMQDAPDYGDVVSEVADYLRSRRDEAVESGVYRERILLDPGFGFGKTLGHNLELLRRLNEFHSLGNCLLVGLSRKRMIGEITGRPVEEREIGSAVAAALAVQNGALIVRAHDVAATVDAVKMVAHLRSSNLEGE